MLNRFIDLQEQKLEKLGSSRVKEQARVRLEQDKMDRLQQLKREMVQKGSENALLVQNRMGLSDQFDNLIGMQEHEVAAANATLKFIKKSMVNQFGKVKALQTVENKKATRRAAKINRAEQTQSDDWVSQSLLRTA